MSDDKYAMTYLEREMLNMDLEVLPFEKREEFLVLIPDENKRKLFLEYVESISQGEKVRLFLERNGILYSDINCIMWENPALQKLEKMAFRLGEELRHRLAVDELHRRSVEGIDKPVYHKGKLVDRVKTYSDTLLKLQLQAGDPNKYSDKQQVDHSGAVLNLNVHGVVRDKD